MWRLKILLLPLGAIAELVVLVVSWGLALAGHTKKSKSLVEWATSHLPTLEWYIDE